MTDFYKIKETKKSKLKKKHLDLEQEFKLMRFRS